MIQISQYLVITYAILFTKAEHTIFTFFFNGGEGTLFYRSRTLFCIYRTVFFKEDYKNLDTREKNIFFLNFYFVYQKCYEINIKRIKSKHPTIKINRRLRNVFDWAGFKLYVFCNKFLFNFFLNNQKLLILDSDYRNYYYFLIHHFDSTSIANNMGFFCPNVKNFSKRNWVYFFSKFCDKNNIGALFFTDSISFRKNVSTLMELGLPIIGFMLHKGDEPTDFSFIWGVMANPSYYLFAAVYMNYAFFITINYKLRCLKLIYIKQFGRSIAKLTCLAHERDCELFNS